MFRALTKEVTAGLRAGSMPPLVQGVACVAILMAAPTISMAQSQSPYAQSQVTFEGTVEAVDHANRTVTIRGAQGNLVALDVPPNATRFNEVKVGDHVTATYSDRISVRLKPAGEPAVDRMVEPQTTPTPGALPVPRKPGSGCRP